VIIAREKDTARQPRRKPRRKSGRLVGNGVRNADKIQVAQLARIGAEPSGNVTRHELGIIGPRMVCSHRDAPQVRARWGKRRRDVAGQCSVEDCSFAGSRRETEPASVIPIARHREVVHRGRTRGARGTAPEQPAERRFIDGKDNGPGVQHFASGQTDSLHRTVANDQ
jgi:hypothetical protein